MTNRSLAQQRTTHDDVAKRIREDAAAHPERTYRQQVEAAERMASEEYREECRHLMRDSKL